MNRKIFIFIIFFSSLTLLSEKSVSQDPLSSCQELLERSDYKSAISCFREVVRKQKKNPLAYLYLGIALEKADSLDSAVLSLIHARELDPTNPRIYESLGDVYQKQNIHVAAAQQYALASQIDSTNTSLLLKLAREYMKTRQWNDAAMTYRRVLALDTTNPDVYRELGKLYFQAKQYQNAVPLLEQLVNREPNVLINKVLLVKALSYVKRYEDVVPLAEEILSQDTTEIEVIRILAQAYNRLKIFNKSEEYYNLLAKFDTLGLEDYLELARAQKLTDKIDEAIKSFEKAYSIDSTAGEIFYDLGTLYMKKKDYANAVFMFEKKIASDTSAGYLFGSHLNAGLCLMQLKEFERARVHILESIRLRPDYIQAWSALASCYAQMDSSVQQREAFQKVIELALAANSNGNEGKYNAQLEEAYRMIGVQLLIEKKFASSIDYLKKALQFSPKDCSLHLWIAQAYHNTNVKEEAIKYYRKVLEICPSKDSKRDEAKKGLLLLGEIVDD